MAINPAELRLGKRKKYSPVAGDEWIKVGDIRPEHKTRVFEARNELGEGYLGLIVDAEHHLLLGVVGIRFEGHQKGIFGDPDALILIKPEGWVYPLDQMGAPS